MFDRSWQREAVGRAQDLSVEKVRRFYTELTHAMAGREGLDLNLLYTGERLVAFDWNLIEGDTVYMVFGVFDQELRRYSPGTLLFIDWL